MQNQKIIVDFVADILSAETVNPPPTEAAFYKAALATPRLHILEDEGTLRYGAAVAVGVDSTASHEGASRTTDGAHGMAMSFSLLPGEFRCGLLIPQALVDADKGLLERLKTSFDGRQPEVVRFGDVRVLVDRFFVGGVFSEDWYYAALSDPIKREMLRMKVAHIARTVWRSAVDVLAGSSTMWDNEYSFLLPEGASVDLLKQRLPLVIDSVSVFDGRLFCIARSSLSRDEVVSGMTGLYGQAVNVQERGDGER